MVLSWLDAAWIAAVAVLAALASYVLVGLAVRYSHTLGMFLILAQNPRSLAEKQGSAIAPTHELAEQLGIMNCIHFW